MQAVRQDAREVTQCAKRSVRPAYGVGGISRCYGRRWQCLGCHPALFPTALQQRDEQAGAHGLGQDVIHAEQVSFLLPFPVARGGVKDDRATRQSATKMLQGTNRPHVRERGIQQDGVDASLAEEWFGGPDFNVVQHAESIRWQHGAHGLGEARLRRDDEESLHASASSGTIAGGLGGAKRTGRSTVTIVPFRSSLVMFKLPPCWCTIFRQIAKPRPKPRFSSPESFVVKYAEVSR